MARSASEERTTTEILRSDEPWAVALIGIP